jgi:Concanavalin A-like lectin/glucanases superfamily
MNLNSRHKRLRTSLVAFVASVPLAAAPWAGMSPALGAPVTQVLYNMNEPANATTMIDSSANGLNATINQAGLNTGVVFSGATGYEWAFRSPTNPPPAPERVIQVRDNALLDPGTDTFTVEIRYRTTNPFGNVIQKGQSASVGGQWKIQAPGGKPSCLFKGSGGKAATQTPTAINNGQWHTVTCVRTPTKVTISVDGVLKGTKNGPTGNINNTIPMTIGGKINCDQVSVTCDYFTGGIDYVKITRGS